MTELAEPKRARGRPRKTEGERDDGNRRQALIAAAAQLFHRKGYDATSTREIAAQVGMQPGSPFYHFGNKQDLLLAVMVEGMKQAAVRQNAAFSTLSTQKTDRDRLRVLIRNQFDVLLGPDSDFIPVMLYEWRSLSANQRQTITQIKDDYEAAWIPVLQALHDSGQLQAPVNLARLMIFGALNWSVQWYQPPPPKTSVKKNQRATLDDLTEAALALFLRDAA
ncbi:MAG: TetR family transcriptional regulator [Limnohabitans sp.]|nr:TetR family transcriptional regulator [Limnohabitans sp.]